MPTTNMRHKGGSGVLALSGNITAVTPGPGGTITTIGTASPWPDGASSRSFTIVIDDETILCSARSANVFTVEQRGFDDTAAASHTNGTEVFHALAAFNAQKFEDHLTDTVAAHNASEIAYAGGTGMAAANLEAAVDELATEKTNQVDFAAHLVDATAAHVASSVAFTPTGALVADDVQEALVELDSVKASVASFVAHLNDATDSHDASAVSVLDALGVFAGADVEAVLLELLLPAGTVLEFTGTVLPTGFVWADGTSYPTVEKARLFAATGYTYGGSGANFNVVDRRQKVGVGKHSSGTFQTLGATGGAETHALSIAELAAHAHGVTDPTHFHGTGEAIFGAGLISFTGGGQGVLGVTAAASTGISIQNTGSGTAHNNLQPYVVCNYIVKI